jgi:2,3-dihydro-2,3-dihydroxybenzoate dehydrogenase
MEFNNKVVLVTGAAQGIGAAVAQAMAHQGAILALCDLQGPAVAAQAAQLRANGAKAHSFALDVSQSGSVNEVVTGIERDIGPIAALVNVAGVLHPGAIIECTDADWEHTFTVNTGGVFRLCRAVAPHMMARTSGVIITVASNAANVPRQHMAAYCASKAASTQFMRCLGLELAPYGIRCNVVAPGSTDTAMQRQLWQDEHAEKSVIEGNLQTYRLGIPLGRMAQASNIADAVCFLASAAAAQITMQTLCVDGGATLGA